MPIDVVSKAIGSLEAGQAAIAETVRAESERARKRDERLFNVLDNLSKAVAPLPGVISDVADMKPQVSKLMGMRKQVLALCTAATIFLGAVGPDLWSAFLHLIKVR